MSEDQKPTFNINGKDYEEKDFNDEQKYLINQVQALQNKEAQIKFDLAQVTVAREAFTKILIDSVEVPPEFEPVED